jgi:cell division control protein 45
VDTHTCDIHLIDSHRPYNLENVFGGAVNDGLGAGTRNGYLRDGRNGHGNDDENSRNDRKGRIWIWGDGDEKRLENVKKSWEALEVGRSSLPKSREWD